MQSDRIYTNVKSRYRTLHLSSHKRDYLHPHRRVNCQMSKRFSGVPVAVLPKPFLSLSTTKWFYRSAVLVPRHHDPMRRSFSCSARAIIWVLETEKWVSHFSERKPRLCDFHSAWKILRGRDSSPVSYLCFRIAYCDLWLLKWVVCGSCLALCRFGRTEQVISLCWNVYSAINPSVCVTYFYFVSLPTLDAT